MFRQFSRDSFSQFGSAHTGYLYEEPQTDKKRWLLPLVVVLSAGAFAYYIGIFTSTQMAREIQTMDLQQAPKPLVQKAVIGADAPEIIVPQSVLPPSLKIVKVNSKFSPKARSLPDSSKIATKKTEANSASDSLEENNVPFQPAEDYVEGQEAENLPALQAPETDEIKTPLPEVATPANISVSKEDTPLTPLPESN